MADIQGQHLLVRLAGRPSAVRTMTQAGSLAAARRAHLVHLLGGRPTGAVPTPDAQTQLAERSRILRAIRARQG